MYVGSENRKYYLHWVAILLATNLVALGVLMYHCNKLNYTTSTTPPPHEVINPPGVFLVVKGGIGNQFFQYACSYASARDLGWPLYFYEIPPSESYLHHNGSPYSRQFALDQFQVPLENVFDNTTMLSEKENFINDRELLDKIFLNSKDKQFIALSNISYCQSMEYWRNYQNDIKAMFKPKKEAIDLPKIQKIINKIERSAESVVVHVRRGDFVNLAYYVPISYQRLAIRKMVRILSKRGKARPMFFVFSDDIGYAKKKLEDFGEEYEMVYVSQEVSNGTSVEEFYLMTLCKHIILPSSTFSWWAAYLMENVEKIVIASAFNPVFFDVEVDDFLHGRLYHPKEWIVIDPFNGGLSKSA